VRAGEFAERAPYQRRRVGFHERRRYRRQHRSRTLVDEAALAGAIKSGHIAAAGLDVLEIEPADPANPLLDYPQALITPHIAGATDVMLAGTIDYLACVIDDLVRGKKPEAVLNAPSHPRRAFS